MLPANHPTANRRFERIHTRHNRTIGQQKTNHVQTREADIAIDPHQVRAPVVRQELRHHGVPGPRDQAVETIEIDPETKAVLFRRVIQVQQP
jgi:hypothetical protein